ncbi:CASR protein, partial [Polypterus senegalus]
MKALIGSLYRLRNQSEYLGLRESWIKTKIQAFNDILGTAISSVSVRRESVSYFASCSCLSDKKEFPYFMRTIPSDAFQIKAIVKLVKHFKWTWVGAVGLDTDYARFGIQLFIEEAKQSDVCIAYAEFFPTTYTRERILEIVDVMKKSSANVVLGFTGEGDLVPILDEFRLQNITHIQWIASEAWSTGTLLRNEYRELLTGSVGFAIRRGQIPGLKRFLTRLRQSDAYTSPFIAELWEEVFECKLNNSLNTHTHGAQSRKPCSGLESMETKVHIYTDDTQLRVSYNVYKAVYAIAHALHNMNSCIKNNGPFENNSCAEMKNIHPWQLYHYMRNVRFLTLGEEVSFDKNGDPIPSYDLINWQMGQDGSIEFVKVGYYDATLGTETELFINDSIILWRGGQVSYFASCNCLSDKLEFPSFMRTIPSDAFQIKAIVRMVKHFKWTWVGAIGLDTDYARFGIQLFVEEAKRSGVCVAYAEFFPTTYKRERILEVVDIIRSSSAKVVLGFTGEGELIPILDEFKRQNITDIQWIASEAWATATLLWSEYRELLIGTIGFAIRKGDIPSLKSFLTRIRLSEAYSLPFIAEFWEEIFNCKLNNSLNLHAHASTSRKPCTGHEDLMTVENTYTDVTQLRVSYNVYKAVYAVAHALRNMNGCKTGQGPFANNSCGDIRNVLPWQLLHYMKEVNFTTFGQEVSFDKNGDPIASYDLVNWHEGPGGSVQFVKMGFYDAALEGERELFINDSIIFWHGGKQAPVSVCSNSCLPGSRKAPRKGQPSCCFDCIPCADGEISNQTDSIECFKCALEDWSNEARDRCLPKIIEYSGEVAVEYSNCVHLSQFKKKGTDNLVVNSYGVLADIPFLLVCC